jgi:hypothetical protein
VWLRDWYEDGANEPWDGAHQRADEVDRMRESWKMRFRKSFCVGFCVCGARTQPCARPIQNEPNERYCGAEERCKGMLPEQTEWGKVSL